MHIEKFCTPFCHSSILEVVNHSVESLKASFHWSDGVKVVIGVVRALMNQCKSKVGIGIDIDVISSTELQWQKKRRLFSFPSDSERLWLRRLPASGVAGISSWEINHNATTTATTLGGLKYTHWHPKSLNCGRTRFYALRQFVIHSLVRKRKLHVSRINFYLF